MTTHGENIDAALAELAKATERANAAAGKANAAAERAEAAASTPPPVVPPPDVTTPPDVPGKLPVRKPGKPLKNKSGQDLYLSDPQRYDRKPEGEDTAGVWLNESGVYNVSNLETQNIGGTGGLWQHSIYSGGGGKDITLNLTDFWAHDLTRSEKLSRDHLGIYAESTTLNADRILIGEPGDTHPPDIPVKLACYGDATPRPTSIGSIIGYNSRRVLIEARVGPTAPVSRLHVDLAIIVNPIGDGHGGAEFFDLANIPDLDIGTVIIIDSAGNLTDPTIIKAKNCNGRVGRVLAYLPAIPHDRQVSSGWGDLLVERIVASGRLTAPAWTLDRFDELVKCYGGAG